ncbi:MAG: hypothetical protein ACLVJX_00175 [Merdibacter sp.]
MDQTTIRIIVVAVILSIVFSITLKVLKERRMQRLVACIRQKDTERFLNLAQSRFTRFLFPPYNIEYLKLNAYLMEEDTEKIDAQFDKMLQFHLSKEQDQDLTMKAFNYYLGAENRKKTRELLTRIKGFEEKELTKEAQKLYDILIEKSSSYIADMEKQLADADEENKVFLEFLLYMQYKNANNTKKADIYRSLYQQHTSTAPQTTA